MTDETKESIKIGYLISFLSELGIFSRLAHKTETGEHYWSVIWKPFKAGNHFIQIEESGPLSIALKRIFDKHTEEVNLDWQKLTEEKDKLKNYYDIELIKVEKILRNAETVEKEIKCL